MTTGLPHNLHLYNGPSFANFQWCLKGTQHGTGDGSQYHLLQILTQAPEANFKAYITGNWGPTTDCVTPSGTKEVTGQITQIPDDSSFFDIVCRWHPPHPNESQTQTLTGNITFVPGRSAGRVLFHPEWVLQGSVVVTGADGNVLVGKGPGDVVGTMIVGVLS
jgi:hypothetical protein